MKATLIPAAFILIIASAAFAADVTVSQMGKQFDRITLDVSVGDRIVFENNDNVAHNVHSKTYGHRFNLGVQKPGQSTSLEITRSGTFQVRCAVHPKMLMTVTAK